VCGEAKKLRLKRYLARADRLPAQEERQREEKCRFAYSPGFHIGRATVIMALLCVYMYARSLSKNLRLSAI
jgi:hypothetical protein